MLRQYLLSQDKITLALAALLPLFVIAMMIKHTRIEKKEKNGNLWRAVCFVPLLLCLIHFLLYYFKGAIALTWSYYGLMYVAALIIAVWQIFARDTSQTSRLVCAVDDARDSKPNGNFWSKTSRNIIIYRVASGVTLCAVTGLCFANMVVPALSNPVVGNGSKENYVDSFLDMTEEMEAHYCLNAWKEIDYASLKEKILPEVEKAQQENDAAGYLVALCKYTYYFHDSHVYVGVMNQADSEVVEEAKNRLAGNDYGFSMITYTSGETVAVLVDEESEAYAAGIRNGTRILSWEGVPVDEAKSDVECIYYGMIAPALLENENKLKAAFLAGKGEDTIEVEFANDNEDRKTVSLKTSGSYAARLDTFISRFYQYDLDQDNFEAEMIADSCGYLRIEMEQYRTISDVKAVFCDEYPEIHELLSSKLTELKEQGMETLIIDTRNNYGGYNVISAEIASLFTDRGGFNYAFGDYENGVYVLTDSHSYEADGTWKDLHVVVVTNASCMSAGDQLVNLLSRCENVTVVGTTCSAGVNQNNGGICLTTDSEFAVRYPFALTLNEAGEPNIDADKSRKNRVCIDQYIPIDDAYIQAVFGETDVDYELEYILENLIESNTIL